MKKRLLYILLTIVMVMGLIPLTAMANAYDEPAVEPALKLRHMVRDKNTGDFYEDMTYALSSHWNTSMGSGSPVKFYFVDGEQEIPVSVKELKFPNIVSVLQEDGKDYINLITAGIGSGNIRYAKDGKEYTLPVTINLPYVGCYSSQTASAETYLSAFSLTEENNVFYLVASGNYTLTNITLPNDLADIARADKVSDTCWKITVTGTPNGNFYTIRYSGTDKTGTAFENFGISIQISDARACLFYKTKATDNPTKLSDFNEAPSNTAYLLLYYGTETNLTPLTGGTLTPSDHGVIQCGEYSITDGTYSLSVLNWGTTRLKYTDGTNAYYADIVIDIPTWTAFYSSQARTQETYLPNPIYDPQNETVLWLMSKYGFSADEMKNFDVLIGGTNFSGIKAEGIERGANTGIYDIKITLPKELNLKNNSSFQISWGTNNFHYTHLQVKEVPRLLYRKMSTRIPDSSSFDLEFYEDTSIALRGWETLTLALNNTQKLCFYYGTIDNAVPVDDISAAVDSGLIITSHNTADLTPYWEIDCEKTGTVTVTFTADNETYMQELTIGLPSVALYSQQLLSEESYLPNPIYDPQNGTVLWLMSKYGFSADEMKNFDVLIGGTNFSGIKAEGIERGENTGIYDIKITLPKELSFQNNSSFQISWGANNSHYTYLKVKETPRLLYRYMSTKVSDDGPVFGPILGGELFENTSIALQGWETLDLTQNNTRSLRFYYGTTDNAVPVDEISAVWLNSGLKITQCTTNENTPYWDILCEKAGTFTVTFKVGDETYFQDLTVAFPNTAFYSSEVRSNESLLQGYINYRDLTNGTIWLIREKGFTAEELETFSITEKDEITENWTAVERIPNSGVYDIKIVLTKPSFVEEYYLNTSWQTNGSTRSLIALIGIYVPSNAAYFGDYAVGFVWFDELTEIARINEGNWRFRDFISGDASEGFQLMKTLHVAAGTKHTDELGAVYFLVDDSNTVKLKILKTWIEVVDGASNSFSLSQNKLQTENSDYENDDLDVAIYANQASAGAILVWARVEVTIDGVTKTTDISMLGITTLGDDVDYDVKMITRPMDDTVDKLNADLADLASEMKGNCIYTIELAPIDYEGTIVIPEKFHAGSGGEKNLSLLGTYDSQTQKNTSILGAINLNGATLNFIRDLYFRASANTPSALYGGALLNMKGCSFSDYDIAVDSSYGMITVTEGNVFVNNGIAARIDVAFCKGGMNIIPWSYNTFINNGTAIQILSLNDFISPYYFRIVNSNFINNATDFDVQCKSTLYMYKNYYGAYKNTGNGTGPKPGAPSHNNGNGRDDLRLEEVLAAKTEKKLNNILKYRNAKITESNGAKVITNPRWNFPEKDWWGGNALISDAIFGTSTAQPMMAMMNLEPEYENFLISDWELDTQIVNREAKDLLIDASAFEDDGEKQIDVVDEAENPIGIWNFGTSDKEEEEQP